MLCMHYIDSKNYKISSNTYGKKTGRIKFLIKTPNAQVYFFSLSLSHTLVLSPVRGPDLCYVYIFVANSIFEIAIKCHIWRGQGLLQGRVTVTVFGQKTMMMMMMMMRWDELRSPTTTSRVIRIDNSVSTVVGDFIYLMSSTFVFGMRCKWIWISGKASGQTA